MIALANTLPPPMAVVIAERSKTSLRTVLTVGLDGQLYGSLADGIAILEHGITPLEGTIATAYLGLLRAIRKARETK